MENLTKIICTIGPASQEKSVLKKMIEAGMDCARLNFSHGTNAQFSKIIKNVKDLERSCGRQIAIIQDLQGPKIRTGEMGEKGFMVRKGERITLSINNEKNTVPIQYRGLPRDVKNGDAILIDDGMIELKVKSINAQKTKIECVVIMGGVIKSRKGINVPNASISAESLTSKDKKDLDFGLRHGVDFVALSFVKSAKEIFDLRRIIKKRQPHVEIIAKIERHEAIKNIEEIVAAADAIMVARGDLGVEMPAELVPIHQKKIIHLCNAAGKPVIVATQMLESMIENSRATRAEISDAATAIFDHADAFMLSNETAVGKYPVEAAQTLERVASAVEKDLKKHQHLLRLPQREEMPLTNATCLNACKLADDIRAKFIVALTRTGYTAREIAKYRSFIPIVVFTPDAHVGRQMSLVWGVTKAIVQKISLTDPLPQIRKILIANKSAKTGDEIVVCNAGRKNEKLIMTAKI